MADSYFHFQSSAKVSFVIPAYNEEERIMPLLEGIDSLSLLAQDIEVIIVDDGSLDRTSDVCQKEIDHRFPLGKVIKISSNRGKGNALRIGVSAASSPTIITMDADMATDLSAVEPALMGLKENHIVVGSRAAEGSKTQGVSNTRRLITNGFSLFLRIVTSYKVSDTQCGFKAYRSPVAKVLFASSRAKGFAQDAEILDLAYRNNLSILEIPVLWTAIPGSKVNLVRDSFSSFFEVIRHRLNGAETNPISGLTIHNETEGQALEEEILNFFPKESIFLITGLRTDILFPEIRYNEIQRLADTFNRRYPHHQVQHCMRTIQDIVD